MDRPAHIPIHDFTQDDETSIDFKIEPLTKGVHQDATEPHRHNFYEIFLFRKGGGDHIIDFDKHKIEDQSIHFVSPGQVHLVQRKVDSYGMLIYFSRDFFLVEMQNKDWLFTLPFLHQAATGVLNLEEKKFAELCNIAENMQLELEYKKELSSELIHGYLNIFLLKCRRAFYATADKSYYAADGIAEQFKIMLEKRFRHLHLVKEYAAQLNVSSDILNTAVKEAYGTTAGVMISERLLLEAKRLLRYSPYSIKEISYFLNFTDPAYFGRFIKNNLNVTPQQFRDKN